MMSFDQSLTELVQRRFVTYEEALANATNPDDFALHFRGVSKGGGAVGTDFQQAPAAPQQPARQPAPAGTRMGVTIGQAGAQNPGTIAGGGAGGGAEFEIERFK
jgi:twitching motility protein PilT